jgi:hypothetical protein
MMPWMIEALERLRREQRRERPRAELPALPPPEVKEERSHEAT